MLGDELAGWLKELQNRICAALEKADGKEAFTIEPWERAEGGGGITRVIQKGAVLEKGGVNFSAVHGAVPAFLLQEKEHAVEQSSAASSETFFATGVSIVLHP